jgi:hypothetical protein
MYPDTALLLNALPQNVVRLYLIPLTVMLLMPMPPIPPVPQELTEVELQVAVLPAT